MPNPYDKTDSNRRGKACDHARKVRVYGQEVLPCEGLFLFKTKWRHN